MSGKKELSGGFLMGHNLFAPGFHGHAKNRRINIHVFFIMLGFFVLGCTKSVLQPLPMESGSNGQELRLLARVEKEQAILEESGFIYEDGELEKYLNEVVKKLYHPTDHNQSTPTVKVVKDPHLNAFVFPNGRIYIHTGILARLDNEAQLAFLLAHEIIHYTHRHAFKTFDGFKDEPTGPESQWPDLNPLGRVGDLLSRFGATLTMAVMTGYSQALETEADVDGMALVSKTGYNPGEAIRFFEHLRHELETENLKEPFFFGIHPRIPKRIENCEIFLKGTRQTENKGLLNEDVYLQKTRKVILYNAFLELKAGRYVTARRSAEKYLVLNKDDARVYYLLGEILRLKGETEEINKMKRYYEKAIYMDPVYAEPYRAIGLIHYKEEAWGLARKAFESYLALSPHVQDRAYILEYLKECNAKGV